MGIAGGSTLMDSGDDDADGIDLDIAGRDEAVEGRCGRPARRAAHALPCRRRRRLSNTYGPWLRQGGRGWPGASYLFAGVCADAGPLGFRMRERLYRLRLFVAR